MDDEDLAESYLKEPSSDRPALIASWAANDACGRVLLEAAEARLRSDPESSILLSGAAAGLHRARSRYSEAARAGRVQGQALRLLSRHEEAVAAMDRAAADAQQAGDRALAARVRLGAIDSLGWLSRTDEALALAADLERVFLAESEPADAARVLVNTANLLWRQDRYAEALGSYERAEQAFHEAGEAVSVARVEANRANALTMLDRVEEALALFDRSRLTFERAGLAPEAAMVEGNAGYLHFVCGRFPAALASLQRARSLFASAGRDVEAAKADLDAADVYRALNLDPEAAERYESAERVFRRNGIDYELAKCLLGLTWVRGRRRPADGLALVSEAERLFRRQRNRVQQAHSLLVRAHLLHEAGRATDARRASESASRLFRVNGLAGWNLEARFIAASQRLAADPAKAGSMQRVAAGARRLGRGLLESRAQRALGVAHRGAGRLPAAIARLRRSVAVLEQARSLIPAEDLHTSFLRDKLGAYGDLVGALIERGRPRDLREALVVAERCKSRLLVERIAASVERDPFAPVGASPEVLERIAKLRAELSRSYMALHGALGEARRMGVRAPDAAGLSRLERTYAAALREAELSAEGPRSLDLIQPPRVAALQSLLGPDECLVEYFATDTEVHAFLLAKSGLRAAPKVACREEVDEAARALRFQLHRATGLAAVRPSHLARLTGATDECLSRLHELLVAPLSPERLPGTWVVVPHGPLHGLPFHAFREGADYLLDRRAILYAPSAATWAAVRRRARDRPGGPKPGSALVMAIPTGNVRKVVSEAKRISGAVGPGVVACRSSATCESFRRNAPSATLIHLATHAIFRADNPMFSGIRLSDGWLVARDLYDMRLDCDLVSLSACNTGVNEPAPGDELFGLCRGFLAAGARNMAVSLWAADDRATEDLMVRFYKGLSRGLGAAESLRRAQLEVRKRFAHPYFWAHFALVGGS